MFQCPNCGGNVRFDIPSQMIACEYCGTKQDPYFYENKASDGIETTDPDNYEVTIFTCPQCGGEILSTDNAAAGFCSFCGASTVLYSRIERERRPNYIIPFLKTKDDCKAAYTALMKKAVFAPSELKDPSKIDSFRGIYMPYWAFDEAQQGPIALAGEKSHRAGDYIITDHFRLTGEIDSYYKGLSYDASSSFADNISEAIAPYDVKGMKNFTPAFFSGFYADTADVDASVYQPDAEETAFRQSLGQLRAVPEFRGYSVLTGKLGGNPKSLCTYTRGIDSAMYPVWFMSYRSGDRVAYATVNGQTGKAVADIPVDIKKFLLGSCLLALPLFVILNLFYTVVPSSALTLTGVIAGIVMILSGITIHQIVRHERHEDDKGFLFRMNKRKPQGAGSMPSGNASAKKEGGGARLVSSIVTFLAFGMIFAVVLQGVFGDFAWNLILWAAALLAGVGGLIAGLPMIPEVPGKKGLFGMLLTSAGLAVSAGIELLQPVSDLWYYGAAIFLIVSTAILEIELMEQYNLTATRRLPQFDKQGGDDRA